MEDLRKVEKSILEGKVETQYMQGESTEENVYK
jgi:hypothetical protein